MDCTTNLVMSIQQHSPQCSCYCGCIHPMKKILVRGTWIPSLMRLKQFCIHRFVACKIPGQQQADLPVSRNSQVQEQNLMELAWLGPSTVRNPSVEDPSVQGAEWTWRTHSPECLASVTILDATACPAVYHRAPGTLALALSLFYQPRLCLEPDASTGFPAVLDSLPCCPRFPPGLARYSHLW